MKKVYLIALLLVPFLSFSQWFDITPDLNENLFFTDIHILNEDAIFFFGSSRNLINDYQTGLVLKTTDGGKSWEHIRVYHKDHEGVRGPYIRGGAVLYDSTFALTCSDGVTKVFMGDSINHGSICGFCDHNEIEFLKDSTIVIGANHKTSYDMGVSCKSINPTGLRYREAFYRNEDTVVFTTTEKYDFTGTTYQKVRLSKNKGIGYKTVNVLSNNEVIKYIAFKDGVIYGVGTNGYFISIDTDLLQKEVSTMTSRELRSMYIVSANNWFVGGGIYEGSNDFRQHSGIILGTIDGGESWHSTKFPKAINKIEMYDSNNGYAISQKKIYKTINGGIENLSLNEDSDTQPYPNPAKTVLYTSSTSEKSIFNMQGQLLCNGNEKDIDIHSFSKGIYLLKTEENTYKWVKE